MLISRPDDRLYLSRLSVAIYAIRIVLDRFSPIVSRDRFRARFIALGLLFLRSKHIREGRGRDEELISRIVNEIVSTGKHVC